MPGRLSSISAAALASWVPFKVTEKKDVNEIGGNLSIKVICSSGKGQTSLTEQQLELDTDVVSVFCNALKNVADSGTRPHQLRPGDKEEDA
jgi:hypothetical protein